MKRVALLLLLIIAAVTDYAQVQVWQNYYSKNNINSFADNGNYINFIKVDQLVQFQKSTGYFQYSQIPSSVFTCASSHDSLKVYTNGLTCDKQGNLWLSTVTYYDSNYFQYSRPYNLFKYDGTTWSSVGATLSAAGYENNLLPTFDRSGNMWFLSQRGLLKYDGNTFTQWDTINSALPKEGFTTPLQLDSNDNVWMAINNRGIMRFDGSTFTIYDTTILNAPSNGFFSINGIYINKSNNDIYAIDGSSTDTGYYYFDGAAWSHKSLDTALVGMANSVTDVFFDHNNNAFFGCYKGLVKYDGTQYTLITNGIPNYNTSYNYFTSEETDLNGDMWLIANSNFSKYDGNGFTVYNDNRGVLENDVMIASVVDKNGSAWFSYWGGGGLTKYDHGNFSTAIGPNNHGSGDPILCMAVDSTGKIFYGTGSWNSLYTYTPSLDSIYNIPEEQGACSSYNSVYGITIDKQHTVWAIGSVAGACGGFSKIVGDTIRITSLPIGVSGEFSCIAADSTGNIWLGMVSSADTVFPSPSSGLIKYDGNANAVVYDTGNSGLPENEIQSLAVDSANHLWVGTINKGVAYFNGSNWTVFDTSNTSLPSNHIESIFFRNGKIFIATQQGFSILDGTTWTTYTTSNSGLVNGDVESIVVDNSCNVWVSTECGLGRLVGACSGENIIYGTVAEHNRAIVSNMEVYLMKLDVNRNKLVPIDNTLTDASGQYQFATKETDVYVYAEPNKTQLATILPGYNDTALVQQLATAIHFTGSSIQKNIVCNKTTGSIGNLSLSGVVNTITAKATDLRLYLMLNNQPVATAVTGIDGHFSFENLPAGTYTIWVDKMGIDNNRAPSVTINSGNTATAMLHDTYLELLTVGIPEVTTKSLDIFPNPSHGRITCTVTSDVSETALMSVYDVNGIKVTETKVSNGTQTIDLSSLPNGIYFVQVVSSFTTQQDRLVILR